MYTNKFHLLPLAVAVAFGRITWSESESAETIVESILMRMKTIWNNDETDSDD